MNRTLRLGQSVSARLLAVALACSPLLAQDPATCPLHGTAGHGDRAEAGRSPDSPAGPHTHHDSAAARASDDHRSPYVEIQQREIKALGDEEISKLLAGEGMGLAIAAELNGYPGPKHLLELADAIGLDAAQLSAITDSFDRMHGRAVELGAAIIAAERDLDQRFRDATIDRRQLESATARMAELRGELRAVHLAAHLEAKGLLSDDQVSRYHALRGYGAAHQP